MSMNGRREEFQAGGAGSFGFDLLSVVGRVGYLLRAPYNYIVSSLSI
jgi:hypothetical protein